MSPRLRRAQAVFGGEDLGVRKMVQPTGVVVVQVRHHELADVAGYIYAHHRETRPDLLLRRNPYLHHVLEEGVGARQIIPERVARCPWCRR